MSTILLLPLIEIIFLEAFMSGIMRALGTKEGDANKTIDTTTSIAFPILSIFGISIA